MVDGAGIPAAMPPAINGCPSRGGRNKSATDPIPSAKKSVADWIPAALRQHRIHFAAINTHQCGLI